MGESMKLDSNISQSEVPLSCFEQNEKISNHNSLLLVYNIIILASYILELVCKAYF